MMRIYKISIISTSIFLLNLSLVFAQEIIKTNLSDSINTIYTESKPMISADGNYLFFARQNSPDNFMGVDDDQDIYVSKYGLRGWEKAINIGEPLNNEYPNGVVSVSPTANSLFLLDAYDNSKKEEGIAVSHLTDSGWTVPKKVVIKDFYNKSSYIDYFFSTSGKELLIAVDRNDSYGDQDLYVSKKDKDGNWSTPINLGEQINTKRPEFSPFLAADNKTLFFASMGHENYGNADIFYSKRLDSTWTNWSEPQNLGPDVNSEGFEAYYTIPANGSIGYYVSAEGGREGSRDIYSITIPYQFRPDPVILLKGQFLSENNSSDSIEYNVNFLTTSASESEVNIDYESNHFNAILPTGASYFFYVNKSNVISESHYIDLTNQKEYMIETADIHTVPVQEGESFTSHNIQFEKEGSEFVMSTYFELVRLLEDFKQYVGLQFELTGHAHDFEDSLQNLELSKERLEKIREFYVQQDFNEDQFILTPKGDVELNQDDYKKHINSIFNVNNRIDFKIISTNWAEEVKLAMLSENTISSLSSGSSASKAGINQSESEDIVIKNYSVLFDFDDVVIDENQKSLMELNENLKKGYIKGFVLTGHTCNVGDENYNRILSEKRAESLKNWLIKHGVKSENISIEPKGELNPIADNSSIDGRKLNRRVEVQIRN
ncbi:OmpA family protein [Marivirga arenosa]|uniref:OmpA family protein n=1 Tax=Marivirga arenosa TaxID=3059076 RepID=A0AA51X395_9BACT|nr:OmpA family protein [Marivirga sp. BKB1-2]WNB16897.1 OmpA family protein [Marivirga sp. BKB1-2]